MCLSPPQQDTQSTSVLPDDSGSVLMDDTASQWSAAADSEEERKSALEKSMYVFFAIKKLSVFALQLNYGCMNACMDVTGGVIFRVANCQMLLLNIRTYMVLFFLQYH